LSHSTVSDGVIVYGWVAIQWDNKYTYGYMIWRRYPLGRQFTMIITNKKWRNFTRIWLWA